MMKMILWNSAEFIAFCLTKYFYQRERNCYINHDEFS